MQIAYKKHINTEENNRVEFLLINYDYVDGNDILAKMFKEDYGMLSDVKIDGIYYSIIKLYSNDVEYDLIWHEDVGNYLYSLQQDEKTINELENRLKSIIAKINKRISTI